MTPFYSGYGAAIYAGFIAFVALNISGHPEPLLFALLFLTIWPLVAIMAGYEPIIHFEADHERTHHRKPPDRWMGGIRDGVATGLVVSAISLTCERMLQHSLWFLAPPLLGLLLGPYVGVKVSLWRFRSIRATQQAGSSDGDKPLN
jgi:hypothetical protein